MESSRKILNNYDVLQLIFRYLDFGDHLKLIKICPQFEDAIVHGVWRLMYKNIMISEETNYFELEYYEINDVKTRHSLTSEELHTILHHSSMYICKLELDLIPCLENIISFNYHHLTELLISYTDVGDTHLQQVADNCLNLQSFTLIEFMDDEYQSNIRVNVFDKMKALNRLEIDSISFKAWNYFDLQQLFCIPHLKTLIINIGLCDINPNKRNDDNGIERVYNIENLSIGLSFLQIRNICFENLTKLTISLRPEDIDDNVLTQINNVCPKLCELSFTRCNFSFNEFPRMNNLMHLTFEWCKNIKFKNFDEIIRKHKLKSLSLKDVRMGDKAEDISNYNCISDTLETLGIQHILDLHDVKMLTTFFIRQKKFENVSKVGLRMDLTNPEGSTELCFSHNFPNLQELVMNWFHISSEDILHLKHLKVLQFDHFDGMTWSYLKILFQHPTLTHIAIKPCICVYSEMGYAHLPNCCEGLTTTLEYLSLPDRVYETDLSFWKSFRQRNKLLKFEIFDRRAGRRVAVPM